MPVQPPNPIASNKQPEILFSAGSEPIYTQTILSPTSIISPKPIVVSVRSPIPKPIGNVDVVPVVMDPVGPKVLLVDDQEFNVKILADLMTMAMGLKQDKDYMGTYDGQQALDLVKSYGNLNPFTVVLMDLTMPVLDGYESSKQIIEYCKSAKCSIIPTIYAVTASDKSDEQLKKCQEFGMVDMLAKPMPFPVLMQILKKHGVL